MAKHPFSRSISMSQIPKRSASINSQSHQSAINTLQIGNVIQKRLDKGYKMLARIMFSSQNEHSKKFDKSTINWLLHLLAFFGISWLAARKLPKWTIVSVAFYNLLVFLVQSIFLILLIIDFYISKVDEYKWVTTPFYLYGILLIMSLWLNIRIHSIRSQTIAEAVCSFSINSDYVRRKNKWLKFLSVLFIFLTLLFIIGFVFALRFSNDLFGVTTGKQNLTIFSCGLFCDIIFYYINFMIIVTIVGATGIFALLTVSTLMEAKKLNNDIKSYPSNDGLDHLIFRYQSIDQSAYAIDKHFSCIILAMIFIIISATIVLLQHYTKLMIRQWETGAALLTFYYFFGVTMLTVFLVLATALNEKLAEFRRASQKVSDFQQIYTTNQNSIKFLSFMLRLSDTKEHLRVGSIFAINRQTLFTLFLLLLIVGFVLYSVDTGCLQIFQQ